jgi:hypothetical protein
LNKAIEKMINLLDIPAYETLKIILFGQTILLIGSYICLPALWVID